MALYRRNQWVIYNGKKYQVEVDYEDEVYLYGLKDSVPHDKVKPA